MADDVYRITIKGHLGPEWSNWFDGLTIQAGLNVQGRAFLIPFVIVTTILTT